jgi:alkanesulfonate monooxygenase SsuD/methylene tetrahydromethanopterin reductase-like flavin-dependent oxidoreductase (luciferase family)
MHYDIFFSISQTPVDGHLPTEAEMFRNFFDQVEAADRLGYGTAWIAESHLSSEVQKTHEKPVIPHWEGEVGLNVDFLQLATRIFQRTERIEAGSAIMNILTMGGPIAAAERVSAFGALHGLDPEASRRIHVGFAAGRFDFMNRATGVVPRTAAEAAAGRVWKNKVFAESAEIFVRLVHGETLSSEQVTAPTPFTADDFRSPEHWRAVQEAAGTDAEAIPVERFWTFEPVRIVPQDWRRELVQLVIGSHDPALQAHVNTLYPVHVFNLSITKPEVIDATHARMAEAFHPDGGPWQRRYMPRTVFVFLNEEEGLSAEARREAAGEEARKALGAYWTALEGTLDPDKVERAADNALIGNAEDIAHEMVRRFHPEDRLMLWFDFFNHDSDRVIRNMEAFMHKVAPRVKELLGEQG